ncbi:MAG: PD-(D/E)XK nuclease domain-containing protein [candidate division WOR-3 bacterium]
MRDRNILESEYQWLIASLFKMAGYKTSAEYHTSKGRIDILVETNGQVFIAELKVDESGKKCWNR